MIVVAMRRGVASALVKRVKVRRVRSGTAAIFLIEWAFRISGWRSG
jgi:hypothetical protein